jgi:hypothetical protein
MHALAGWLATAVHTARMQLFVLPRTSFPLPWLLSCYSGFLYAGPELLLAALRSGCRDSVLAVRTQAAPSLATLCLTLEHWQLAQLSLRQSTPEGPPTGHASQQPGEAPEAGPQPAAHLGGRLGQQQPASGGALADGSCATAGGPPAPSLPRQVLPALLALAAHAAQDTEKVRASGVEALGHCFVCLGLFASSASSASGGTSTCDSSLLALDTATLAAAGQALIACLQSSVPKVQWSACMAAGLLLRGCSRMSEALAAPSPLAAQPAWVGQLNQLACEVLGQLLRLLGSCPSMRSRVRAAEALSRAGSMAWYRGSCEQYQREVLQPVCQALFEGRARCAVTPLLGFAAAMLVRTSCWQA